MEKRFLRLPALILFPAYAVFAVLTAVEQRLLGDAVWQYTLWTDAVYVALHWLEIGAFCAVIAFLAVGISRFGAQKTLPLVWLILGALVFKYVFSVAALSVAFGSLDLTYNWVGYLVSFFIEVLMAALVFWWGRTLFARIAETENRRRAAAARLHEDYTAPVYTPFSRLFSRQNPLSRVILWGVLVLAAFRFAAFLSDDIAFSLEGFAYTAADVPATLFYVSALVLLPVFLGYLFALWCAAGALGTKCFTKRK